MVVPLPARWARAMPEDHSAEPAPHTFFGYSDFRGESEGLLVASADVADGTFFGLVKILPLE